MVSECGSQHSDVISPTNSTVLWRVHKTVVLTADDCAHVDGRRKFLHSDHAESTSERAHCAHRPGRIEAARKQPRFPDADKFEVGRSLSEGVERIRG